MMARQKINQLHIQIINSQAACVNIITHLKISIRHVHNLGLVSSLVDLELIRTKHQV
jgi:hypothetical protein